MRNSELLSGSQELFISLRRVSLLDIEVEGYKSGKDHSPVIICREDPIPVLSLNYELQEKPKKTGDWYSFPFFGALLIWQR